MTINNYTAFIGGYLSESGDLFKRLCKNLLSLCLPEIYRTWKTPTDALAWGATILPDLTPTELQKLFDEIPSVNGKKAPVFVEKVLSMAVKF